jgi:hypothetical protein
VWQQLLRLRLVRWLQRLLRHDGHRVVHSDESGVLGRQLQLGQQLLLSELLPVGEHQLPCDELWLVERVLLWEHEPVAHGDDLQLQLRNGKLCSQFVHRDGDVPASAPVLRDKLRAMERMQWHQCLRAGRDTDEVGDDLQSQPRNVPVRGEHQHRDADVSGRSLMGGL